MKKLKKLLTSSVMILVAFLMALASPIVNICQKVFAASYATEENLTDEVKKGATFSVVGLASTGTVGQDVELPGVTNVRNIADGTEYNPADYTTKITVYKPDGSEFEATAKFKPDQIGTYKVEYAVNLNGIYTVANQYNVKVTASSYSYDFIKNDSIILPITVDTYTAERPDVPAVTIPLPKVNQDGKQVDIFYVGKYASKSFVAVYDKATDKYDIYNNVDTAVAAYNQKNPDKVITSSSIKYAMVIEVNTDTATYSNNEKECKPELEGGKGYTKLEQHQNGENKYFSYFKAVEGTNVINYRLEESNVDSGKILFQENKKIEGSNSYDSSKIEIGFTVENATTTASLNDKAYLPLAKAYDKNNSNASIAVYTKVEVQFYAGKDANGDPTYESVSVKQDEKGLYFIPEKAGDYEITYRVEDFYGNEGYAYNYTIKDVKDSAAPTLYLVDSYDIDKITEQKGDLKKQDYKYIVPTKMTLNASDLGKTGEVEIILPAVYAEDSTNGFKDLTITRRITSSDFVADKAASIYLQTDTEYTVYEDVTYSHYEIKDGKFYKKDTTTTVDNVSAHKATQAAKIKLKTDKFASGTYTIYYSVSDKAGNSSSWSTTLNIVENFKDESKPEVSYKSTPILRVEENQVVTYDAPTVTDDTDSAPISKYFVFFPANTEAGGVEVGTPIYHEVKLNKDGKIEFNTNETVYTSTGATPEAYSIYDLAKENDGVFSLVTFALDDYALYSQANILDTDEAIVEYCKTCADPASSTLKNVGVATAKIVIVDKDDTAAPIIAKATNTDFNTEEYKNFNKADRDSYLQNGKIYVDGVEIWDNREALTITAVIKDSEGNVIPAYTTVGKMTVTEVAAGAPLNGSLTAPEKGFVYKFPGISFTASLCDTYTVTYIATDAAGNVSAYSAVLPKTIDKEKPVISGYKTSTYELELGQTLSLVDIVAKDNSGTPPTVTCDCADNAFYIKEVVKGVFEFAPQQTGTYKITFSAWDGPDAEHKGNVADDVVITVNVKHTVKPVVKLLAELGKTKYFSNEIDSSKFTKIYLPGFVVVDETESQFNFDLAELKNVGEIKITGPATYTTKGTTEKDLIEYHKDNDNNQKYSFKPSAKGTYTVTYSAYDAFGNEATPVTIEITVGETVKPTIELEKEFKDLLGKEILVGGTLVFDESKVTVTDNIKTYQELDDDSESPTFGQMITKEYEYKLSSFTITNSSGTALEGEKGEDGKTTFTFDTKGDYTLTLIAQDKAGNTQTYTTTIKVVTEETKTTDVSEVVGIVLILASLAVLAGVIVYFAKSPKAAKNAAKAKKATKKEDKKDEPKV